MMRRLITLSLSAAAFLCCEASANFLADIESVPKFYQRAQRLGYLHPNEVNVGDSGEITRVAMPGIYVSVGTERSFMGVSLCDQCTHLLALDKDPDVVLYNQINIALLKLAQSHGDYIWLRAQAAEQEWRARAPDNPLLTHSNYDFWSKWSESLYEAAHKYPHHFSGANYLVDRGQFERLSQMAKNDRMQAVLVDLSDQGRMANLVSAIRNAGLKVSVLDISNSHEPHYLGRLESHRLFNQFRNVVEPERSLVIATSTPKRQGPDVPLWIFVGFTFELVLSPTTKTTESHLTSLVGNISYPNEWHQKLFSERDMKTSTKKMLCSRFIETLFCARR